MLEFGSEAPRVQCGTEPAGRRRAGPRHRAAVAGQHNSLNQHNSLTQWHGDQTEPSHRHRSASASDNPAERSLDPSDRSFGELKASVLPVLSSRLGTGMAARVRDCPSPERPGKTAARAAGPPHPAGNA